MQSFDKLIFSKSHLKTQYLDLTFSCGTYSDNLYSFPLNNIFEIAKEYNFENVLFVTGENVYRKKLTYVPIPVVLAEKVISGFDCDTIEPDDVFPLTTQQMLKDMPHIIAEYVEHNLYEGRPLSLQSYSSKDFFSNPNKNIYNPLKRSYLVLFEKHLQMKADIADDIISTLVKDYKQQLKNILSLEYQNAYVDYLIVSKRLKSEGISLDEYHKNKEKFLQDCEPYAKQVEFTYKELTNDVDGVIAFKTREKAVLPSGQFVDVYLNSLDVDKLINLRYYKQISFENYFKSRTSIYMPSEKYIEARKEFANFLQTLQNINAKQLHISNFTPERLKKKVEEIKCYILLTYDNLPQENKFFSYPDKILSAIEFEKVKAQNKKDLDDIFLHKETHEERVYRLAHLIPKCDQDVIKKMEAFPKYQEMVTQKSLIHYDGLDEAEVNNESTFSEFYGDACIELCMES